MSISNSLSQLSLRLKTVVHASTVYTPAIEVRFVGPLPDFFDAQLDYQQLWDDLGDDHLVSWPLRFLLLSLPISRLAVLFI